MIKLDTDVKKNNSECCFQTEQTWITIGSGNGLLPAQHQAVTWTDADLQTMKHTGTYFSHKMETKLPILSRNSSLQKETSKIKFC